MRVIVSAVAQAGVANALAVAIPAAAWWRLNLSGYRWGVERKRNVLVREGMV